MSNEGSLLSTCSANSSTSSHDSQRNTVERITHSIQLLQSDLDKRIDLIEYLDLKSTVITYTLYEKQHEFKTKIKEKHDRREEILANEMMSESKISLELRCIDDMIKDEEETLNEEIANYNLKKIEVQSRLESTLPLLDNYLEEMKKKYATLKDLIVYYKETSKRSECDLLVERYDTIIDDIKNYILKCEKMQMTGWILNNSELKLADILEKKGLVLNKSGLIFTRNGSKISYEEAIREGYLKDFNYPLDKLFPFVKQEKTQSLSYDSIHPQSELSEGSRISSEDVKYLKSTLGKVLTFALAEITSKQPRDPIHYLAHYLLMYRYNQHIEIEKIKAFDELNKERKRIAKERWEKFILDDVEKLISEMIFMTENCIYENELKRIEEAMMKNLGEEEDEEAFEEVDREAYELLKEAEDQFH